jgi:beta-lactamase class A
VKLRYVARKGFLILILLVFCPWGQAMAAPGLPMIVPQNEWKPLEQCQDPGLQASLTRSLQQRPLWRCLVAEGKMTVGLVDLANPRAPRFAQVNGNTMLYAASIPKIAVLLAAFQGIEDRTLPLSGEILMDLEDMIRESSNPAAACMIRRIGLSKIESLLVSPRYQFYDPKKGGGIWVGSTFGGGGEYRRDPLKDLLQAATATQVCRFYYLLAYGKLINMKRSTQMLQVLSDPGIHDKFISVLEPTISPHRIFRKNGTYGATQCDSVLVWGEGWRRYILVGLIDDAQGEQILRDLVPVAERVLRQSQGRSPSSLRYNY